MARVDAAPGAPRGHLVGTGWPAFRYGPNGEAQIFQRASDVPAGWHDGFGLSPGKEPLATTVQGPSDDLLAIQAELGRRAQALDDREAEQMARERELMVRERACDLREAEPELPMPVAPAKLSLPAKTAPKILKATGAFGKPNLDAE